MKRVFFNYISYIILYISLLFISINKKKKCALNFFTESMKIFADLFNHIITLVIMYIPYIKQTTNKVLKEGLILL